MYDPGKLANRKLHRLAARAYASSEYEFYFTICARHQGQPFNHPSLADEVVRSLLWTKDRYDWILFCCRSLGLKYCNDNSNR